MDALRFHKNCDGMGRRDFLQLGLGALGGMGLTQMMSLQAMAAKSTDTRCIFIWLDGGPSHYETFDPKPEAPSEIRGSFGTVSTPVPGVHFSEMFPKLAKSFKHFTVVRSICHVQNNHGAGNHYLTTGRPTPVPVGCGAYVTFHPSFGSIVSANRTVKYGLPGYIAMPRMTRSGGPNFLGAQHSPFVIADNPDNAGFRVRDISLPDDLTGPRAESRAELRKSLDQMSRIVDTAAADPAVAFDDYYAKAFDLVTSAKSAFDISLEPEEVREKYGRNDFGQRLLLARRLTEVGVPFVSISNGGWDDHRTLFDNYKKTKAERLDTGVSALIDDLAERGSLDNTMVIMLGEFGRTPKVNKDGGRDHWSFAMSVLMAGAGIPGGQIVGATDLKGYYANENIYAPEDFAASLYTKMGIDPGMILNDANNRPIQLVDNGRLIKELFV